MFREKPALHRYPGSMAKRTHTLATHIVDNYDGDAAAIWRDVHDPKELFDRLPRAPRIRRGEGEDLPRGPRQATRRRATGLGAVRGTVRRLEPTLGRRHRLARERSQRVRAWKQEQKTKGKSKAECAGSLAANAIRGGGARGSHGAVVGIRLVRPRRVEARGQLRHLPRRRTRLDHVFGERPSRGRRHGRPPATVATTDAVVRRRACRRGTRAPRCRGCRDRLGAGALTPVSSGSTASWRTPGSEHDISPRSAGASSTIERRNGVSGVTSTGDTPPSAHAKPSMATAPAAPHPSSSGGRVVDAARRDERAQDHEVLAPARSGVAARYALASSAPSLSATSVSAPTGGAVIRDDLRGGAHARGRGARGACRRACTAAARRRRCHGTRSATAEERRARTDRHGRPTWC